MQAACGLAQLERITEFVEARKRNFKLLRQRLAQFEEVFLLPEATEGSDPSWFGFPITLRQEAGVARVDLLKYLDQHKIGTRLLFAGNITRQPYFQGLNFRTTSSLENTDRIMSDTFWLGVYPGLGTDHFDHVAGKLEEFFGLNF
jgi:CDP-6-deoxy-D-xylo-4-hexulose-3-dehydrase